MSPQIKGEIERLSAQFGHPLVHEAAVSPAGLYLTGRGGREAEDLPEPISGAIDPDREVDSRLPAEALTCLGDVRTAPHRVIGGERVVDDARVRAELLGDNLGELENRVLV